MVIISTTKGGHMPSTSGKITKTPTTIKKAATSTKRSTTSKKIASTSSTSNTTTTKKATKKAATKITSPDRLGTLEEKVDKLLTILDTEFRSELRQGPKSLSNKLRSAGLIVKD